MAEKVPERSDVAVESTWDLTRMFSDNEAWFKSFETVDGLLQDVLALKGQLSTAETLADLLEKSTAMERVLDQLYVFAHLREDENTADPESQERIARIRAKYTEIGAQCAWVEPEILSHDIAELKIWANAPCLANEQKFMQSMILQKPHVLSEKEETLLSKAGELFSAPQQIYGYLTNADLTFESITDENGELVEMSDGRYSRFLRSVHRDVRSAAFSSMYKSYIGMKNTLAATLSTTVKKHNFSADIRGHASALDAALFSDQIPAEVYRSLIQGVREKALPPYFDYLSLRRRKLGVKSLDMYDMYVPIIANCDRSIPFSEARQYVLDACLPLGDTYQKQLKQAFDHRWIDIYENKGKRSGAYSSGCYDSVPYLLLNYSGTIGDVFTLAHELGHSMHTWLANQQQPPRQAGYPIFLAEIASTLNETLLLHHLLGQANDESFKAYLLNYYCDNFKGTVIRQTMFAEFELLVHELDNDGVPLTAQTLSDRYYALNKDYFGDSITADKRIAYEWARIPHFYYNFYVYKYATSFCASQYFAGKIINNSQNAVDNYLNLLQSGGSDFPLALLRQAGIDMCSPSVFEEATQTFAQTVKDLCSMIS